MNKQSQIFVAGVRGLVGSGIIRCLKKNGYTRILSPCHSELELLDTQAVSDYFEKYKPEYVTKFIPVMPTNLYGPNDNFDLTTPHVLPALIRKFHEAKQAAVNSVTIWGTGTPRREFLHVDDLSAACVYLMNLPDDNLSFKDKPLFNIGTGTDLSIKELAEMIKEITDFKGEIVFDTSKPDGTPQKLLDISKLINLGWQAKIDLKQGINSVYALFKKNVRKVSNSLGS